jgi:hypothetical protein
MAAARKHFHLEICASSGNFPIVRLTSSEMTKSERRMTKEAQSTNDECGSHRPVAGLAETRTAHSAVARAAYSGFVIISSFVIRHSSFSAS